MRSNHNGVISEIDNLPGCSQVAVFHSVFVPPGERGKGLGKEAHNVRLEHAQYLGYNCAMCTVNMDNLPQLAILEQAGWKCVHTFKSIKTNHMVGIFVKDV